jgi:quercetin dioxygenase-like cupin family protein
MQHILFHEVKGLSGGFMATKISAPTIVEAAGRKIKIIEEYFGRVNTGSPQISIARMKSPEGWLEPGQTPEFEEYTVVLKGCLVVKTENEEITVNAGEAVLTEAGEWVQYSTPEKGGAEYMAVCLPAFSPATVHRGID